MFLLMFIAAQGDSNNVVDVLLEKGVLGIAVVILGGFAVQTIRQLKKDLDDSLQRERELQRETYTKVLPIVERLTAVADARTTMDGAILEALRDVRRLLERQA